MIERYTLPEMGALWSEQNKFQKWLDVEIAVCEVHAELGTIPRDALEQIKARAQFSVEHINEIEKTTDNDVIEFTTKLAESIVERRALFTKSLVCLTPLNRTQLFFCDVHRHSYRSN